MWLGRLPRPCLTGCASLGAAWAATRIRTRHDPPVVCAARASATSPKRRAVRAVGLEMALTHRGWRFLADWTGLVPAPTLSAPTRRPQTVLADGATEFKLGI